jgi:23S rRNA pseudouridine2605 synthase
MSDDHKPQRLAKVMAASGLCSRRDAERLIAEGRVEVNGQLIETPATLVTPYDLVTVDQIPIFEKPATRLWAFYKPRQVITSSKDPQERTTVFDLLPPKMPRVLTVGRLDYLSEGLLLLTNDGDFSRQLEHPSSAIPRTYEVRIFGRLPRGAIEALEEGITVDGMSYGSIQEEILKEWPINTWLSMN